MIVDRVSPNFLRKFNLANMPIILTDAATIKTIDQMYSGAISANPSNVLGRNVNISGELINTIAHQVLINERIISIIGTSANLFLSIFQPPFIEGFILALVGEMLNLIGSH